METKRLHSLPRRKVLAEEMTVRSSRPLRGHVCLVVCDNRERGTGLVSRGWPGSAKLCPGPYYGGSRQGTGGEEGQKLNRPTERHKEFLGELAPSTMLWPILCVLRGRCSMKGSADSVKPWIWACRFAMPGWLQRAPSEQAELTAVSTVPLQSTLALEPFLG